MEKRDPIPSVALTHGGKFHADDVFSAALLRILQPGIQTFLRRMTERSVSQIVAQSDGFGQIFI